MWCHHLNEIKLENLYEAYSRFIPYPYTHQLQLQEQFLIATHKLVGVDFEFVFDLKLETFPNEVCKFTGG